MTEADLAARDAVPQDGPRAGNILVTEAGVRLPAASASFIKMENWDVAPDMTTPNAAAIVWGYGSAYLHWLQPGGSTDYTRVPSGNLNQIVARTRPGETALLFFSYF